MRTRALTTNWEFLTHQNPVNLLFGIGFGYVHGPVSQSMILNCGVVGYAIFAFGFLRPMFSLPSDPQAVGLRAAVFAIFLLYNVSVAELFYPTTWMFLGIAYWRLDDARRMSRTRRFAPALSRSFPRPKPVIYGILAGAIVCVSPSAAAEPPEPVVRDSRFGVATHFGQGWDPETLMPMVAKSGLGWIRDGVPWQSIEKKKGRYELPAGTDKWIRIAREHGLRIILVLAYGNSLYEDKFDAGAYSRAAAWLARELDGRIDAIEVLNEPENYGLRKFYGGRWNGWELKQSVSPWVPKYVTLLNKAADAIKAANPRMNVIGLGSAPPVGFRELEMGIHPSVDGIVFHPYSRREPEYVPYAATPTNLARDGIATADVQGSFASQIAMFRQRAKQYKATDRLWLTEWGHSTYQPDNNRKRMKVAVTAEQQAAYISRRLVESLGLDVTVSIIYDLRDDCADPSRSLCNFGLLKMNGEPKPSYFAVQRVCEALKGATADEPQSLGFRIVAAGSGPQPQIRSYLFRQEDG
ncbi:MAG: hypothetical protein WKF37_14085, partial [Bryobacteraceae bacterium]